MTKSLFAGLALALLVLLLIRLPSRDEPSSSEIPPEKTATGPHTPLPTLAAETDWSSFDEAELEDLLDQLEDARGNSSRRNEFSVIVNDGETIVTDGYESGPGSFVFTFFTPKIVPSETGDRIEVSTQRIEVDASGKQSEVYLPPMTYRPGQHAGITTSFKSESGEETEGWSIMLKPDIVPGGISVEGSTGY